MPKFGVIDQTVLKACGKCAKNESGLLISGFELGKAKDLASGFNIPDFEASSTLLESFFDGASSCQPKKL